MLKQLVLRNKNFILLNPLRQNSSLVRICDEGVWRRITMSNEKQRNSLGLDMIRSLQSSLNTIDFQQCRVLVISSSQPKIFSAGHNLKELTTEKGSQLHENVFREFTDLCLNLKRLPIPVIAEVKGLAAAAGLQLAASCDIIVASDKAGFSTPGVKFGVFCTTPGVALSRNISHKLAAKMLFTGEAISSQEALNHGLISEVVDLDPNAAHDPLKERVNQLCQQIAANSRFIVALGKKAFHEQINEARLEDAYEIGCQAMLDNLEFEDTQLGLKAFAQKKKPVWSNVANKVDKTK